MMEGGEVMIDIDAKVTCKSSSNTVEINLKREIEVLLIKERDGNVVKVGTNIAPPFPIPRLLLDNIVSFDPQNIYPLLYSTLQDPILCDHLSVKIASEAELKRVLGPLHISLHVTLTPQRLLGGNCISGEDQEQHEPCAICLEDITDTGPMFVRLPSCSHEFHHDCIFMWFGENNACPLCRTPYVDDDDLPYHYSDSESEQSSRFI